MLALHLACAIVCIAFGICYQHLNHSWTAGAHERQNNMKMNYKFSNNADFVKQCVHREWKDIFSHIPIS